MSASVAKSVGADCLVSFSASKPGGADRLLRLQSERSSAEIERVLWVDQVSSPMCASESRCSMKGASNV
jgi:hypothetical protein